MSSSSLKWASLAIISQTNRMPCLSPANRLRGRNSLLLPTKPEDWTAISCTGTWKKHNSKARLCCTTLLQWLEETESGSWMWGKPICFSTISCGVKKETDSDVYKSLIWRVKSSNAWSEYAWTSIRKILLQGSGNGLISESKKEQKSSFFWRIGWIVLLTAFKTKTSSLCINIGSTVSRPCSVGRTSRPKNKFSSLLLIEWAHSTLISTKKIPTFSALLAPSCWILTGSSRG